MLAEHLFTKYFDLAGCCWQWIFFGVLPEHLESHLRFIDGSRVHPHVLFFEFFQAGKIREPQVTILIDNGTDPLFFIPAFGIFFLDSQFLCDCRTNGVVTFCFPRSIKNLRLKNQFFTIFPTVFYTPGLKLGTGRKNQICKLRRHRHEVVLHDEKFQFGSVFDDFDGAVYICMLIDDCI